MRRLYPWVLVYVVTVRHQKLPQTATQVKGTTRAICTDHKFGSKERRIDSGPSFPCHWYIGKAVLLVILVGMRSFPLSTNSSSGK